MNSINYLVTCYIRKTIILNFLIHREEANVDKRVNILYKIASLCSSLGIRKNKFWMSINKIIVKKNSMKKKG